MKAALALIALALAASPARAQILPDGDCAGVYWDLTAAFSSGDRIYARVLVTRAGPGERNAVAMGHWIDPAGAQTRSRTAAARASSSGRARSASSGSARPGSS